MLELAVLRHTGNGEELIDVGLLAETLLFYQRVHVVFDGGTLNYLLQTIGPAQLLEILDLPGVSGSFLRESTGTMTHTQNGLQSYNFAQFRVDPPGKRIRNSKWIALQIERTLGTGREIKRFTRKLIDKLSDASFTDPSFGSKDLPTLAAEELKNDAFVQKAITDIVRVLVPSFAIPATWYFRPIFLGVHNNGTERFVVDTNFDFARLNDEYHKTIPPSHSSLSTEFLAAHLIGAEGTILLGSKYLGEMVIDPATAAIVKIKCVELLRKREAHIKEIDLFQEMHLPQGRKVRECLNSGDRSFAEFLKLLDHARKFKEWLAGRNPDERLLQEYYRAVTAESWIDRLGTKTSRWVVTTGLGAAVEAFYPTGLAIAAAQGLSLLDATLLDRVLKGWRPNQFVERKLADFAEE